MNKAIDDLLALRAEHPDLPVVALVDSDVVADDGYRSWLGEISSSHLGGYATYREQFYDDYDDFIEEYVSYNMDKYRDLDFDEAEKRAKEETAGAWQEAIFVVIMPFAG